MHRYRWLSLVALMVGLAGHIARPGSAEACSLPPSTITVRDTPANGVVVVEVGCSYGNCFEGELPEELPVLDKTTGEMVVGSIVRTTGSVAENARIAWKPASPLIEGHTYEVLWRPSEPLGFVELDLEMVALAAASWSADDIAVTANTWLSKRPTEFITCPAPRSLCEPVEEPYASVGLNMVERVGLQTGIDFEASPIESAGQYVVTAALWAEGEEQPEMVEVPGFIYSALATSMTFDAAADAYCYRVEVRSLVDGSVAVTEDCLPHTFGELTTESRSDEDIANDLGACSAPPDEEGFDHLWCKSRRARCEEAARSDWDELGCDTLEEQCRDVIDPNDAMEPNDTSGSDGDDDADAEDQVTATEPGLEGGCSTTSSSRGRTWPFSWLATVVLGLRARRTRKPA